MSWTYEASLNEYDKEVTQDTSTTGRWTFKRYMYFKPDTYDKWSKGEEIGNKNFSFDLITNNDFPKMGDPCPDNINFYVSAIVSIKNLNSQQHGDHCSYCQVTVEYENKKKVSSGSSGGNPSKSKPPWQRPVEDFTVVSQEMSKPLTKAYDADNKYVTPATSAGQPYYDLTGSYFIQRATWTYATKSGNYSLSKPIINSSKETLFGKFEVPAGAGLLLPPGYRKLYWSENGTDNPQDYEEWSFEILIDTTYYHNLTVLNAGTKFKKNSNLVDICTWYVYDPSSSTPPQKQYGDYADMMAARANVHAQNKNIKEESKKLQWFGDFTQSPLPISKSNNSVDTAAIANPSQTEENVYRVYDKGNWHLGGAASDKELGE